MYSQFNIINASDDEELSIAIFMDSVLNPQFEQFAWKIARPSIGTTAFVSFSDRFAVHISYEDKTQSVPIDDLEGAYLVSREGKNIVLRKDTQGTYPENQVVVRVAHNVQLAVKITVLRDDKPIFSPEQTSPGDLLQIQIATTIYLFKVQPSIQEGSPFVADSHIKIRNDQTAYVTGSVNDGYIIKVKPGLHTASS